MAKSSWLRFTDIPDRLPIGPTKPDMKGAALS